MYGACTCNAVLSEWIESSVIVPSSVCAVAVELSYSASPYSMFSLYMYICVHCVAGIHGECG